MRIEEIMRREVRSVPSNTDLSTLGNLMATVGCGFMPVVDEPGKVLGVVTDRDICLATCRTDQPPSRMTAGQVMGRQVHACAPDDDVHSALATMALHHVRRLPVIDADGALRGVVSIDDVALNAHVRACRDCAVDLLYADVARTLGAICEHLNPVPAH